MYVETALWIGFLIFTVSSMTLMETEGAVNIPYLVGASFLCFGAIDGLRAFIGFDKKFLAISDIISGALMAACAIAVFIGGTQVWSILVGNLGFVVVLIFKRVIRLILNHKPRHILFAVMEFIILAVLCFFVLEKPETSGFMFLSFFCIFIGIGNTLIIAFSRIHVGLLLKIIRRTYVGEILFGLITLIAVCGYIFYKWEDGFATYGDGLWYCFAIVTTIGFGDFSAATTMGRVLSVILGIYGIIVVASFTSVIVNFYQETNAAEQKEDTTPRTIEQIDAEVGEEFDKKPEEPSEQTDEKE